MSESDDGGPWPTPEERQRSMDELFEAAPELWHRAPVAAEPIDHRPTIAPTPNPNRQRHDHLMSQPIGSEGDALQDRVHTDLDGARPAKSAKMQPEPPASVPSDALELLRRLVEQRSYTLNQSECRAALDTLERDRAAEVERLKTELSAAYQTENEIDSDREQLRAERDKYCGELGRVTVAHAAEVERLRGELAARDRAFTDIAETLAGWRESSAGAVSNSPVYLARRVYWMREELNRLSAAYDKVCAELAEARARPVPTREQIADVLRDSSRRYSGTGKGLSSMWLFAADAVLALFGAEPKGQTEPIAEARASVALDKGDTQTRVCEPDGLDGMPTAWLERIEAVEKFMVVDHSRLAKLELWQRHIEAHHQPAEHSKRIGELERLHRPRIEREEKGGG